MQNLPRLLIVVAMLLGGTAWTVSAYLEGMRPARESAAEVPGVVTIEPEAAEGGTSGRSASEAAEPGPAPQRSTIVLSVDPTLEDAVSMTH